MAMSHRYRQILSLGFPILIGQLGMIVVGFADNAMVGQYSTDALAAASFVNNVFNVVVLMCLGFTYGLTPIIGSLWSRREYHMIGATLRDGIRLNLLYSLLLTLVMSIVYMNVDRLGQPEHLLPLIRPYYLIFLAGVVPIALFQTFAQWAYAVNSTKMPMWIILSANILNILGNWVLIYGNVGMPEMGLTGAGVATLVSRWFCPIVIFIIFLRVKRYKLFHAGFFVCPINRGRIAKIFRTSMPVSIQLGLETGSFSCAAVMAGWLGDLQLAAFQVLLVVGTLGFCVYYSFGTATAVTVANAAGSGNHAEMRRMAMTGYKVILATALLSSLIFLLGSRQLISIFTVDEGVERIAVACIVPLILYQLADATQITFSNALRGTSRVIPMIWISLAAYVVVGIPATYLMGFTLEGGLTGIYYSFSVSLMVAALLYFYFFMKTTSASPKTD